MKIIGEKINGTRKRVKQAISEKDAGFIENLAKQQVAAGSSWLDLNAGTHPEDEPGDMIWLVETVQAVVDIPLCLDSANPRALSAAIKATAKTPMINSINGEKERLEGILPLVAEYNCEVIALAMGGVLIPETCEGRLEEVHNILEATRRAGIPDNRIYIDPLVMTISTNIKSAVIFFDTLKAVRQAYPEVHFTAGLSNISFGLPVRSYINRTFLILAMQAGLESAICDPLDKELKAAILTTELLLGKDPYCMNFTQSYREGILDMVKNNGGKNAE
ncbi:MAG: dihydropteroate synthase [Spirochaetales bacterium]|nr:dihydropteroate synthase [Spirochaetales bacterium]